MKPLRLFLAAFVLAGASAPSTPQLPDLHGTTLSGSPFGLAASEHKVVVVHYWATWCTGCRVEMPILDAAYKKYGATGLTILGIAIDTGASRKKIQKGSMGASFPLARLADTSLRARDVPAALPETRVYGRDGRLRFLFRAEKTTLDATTLDRVLPPLLAER